jgi:hypothetical protein
MKEITRLKDLRRNLRNLQPHWHRQPVTSIPKINLIYSINMRSISERKQIFRKISFWTNLED